MKCSCAMTPPLNVRQRTSIKGVVWCKRGVVKSTQGKRRNSRKSRKVSEAGRRWAVVELSSQTNSCSKAGSELQADSSGARKGPGPEGT